MKKSHYKYTFFLGLTLCFFFVLINSCNRKYASVLTTINNDSTDANQQVLFLNLQSELDSVTGNPIIKIMKQKVITGDLPEISIPDEIAGSWQISLLDKNGKQLDSLFIANPHVFYAEIPGDDGTFTTQKILLVKTEIALRLKNSSAAKEIEIVEFVHEDKKMQLFKSRLH